MLKEVKQDEKFSSAVTQSFAEDPIFAESNKSIDTKDTMKKNCQKQEKVVSLYCFFPIFFQWSGVCSIKYHIRAHFNFFKVWLETWGMYNIN